jgi:hypothetical protein
MVANVRNVHVFARYSGLYKSGMLTFEEASMKMHLSYSNIKGRTIRKVRGDFLRGNIYFFCTPIEEIFFLT